MKDDELIDTEALMIVQKILDWRKNHPVDYKKALKRLHDMK